MDRKNGKLEGVEVLRGTRVLKVFDNCYSKPPSLGDGGNSQWSMSVLFSAHGTIFCGQYLFTECEWHVHLGSFISKIGDIKLPPIPDNEVEYWFHGPEFEFIMEEVRKSEITNGKMQCRNNIFEPVLLPIQEGRNGRYGIAKQGLEDEKK